MLATQIEVSDGTLNIINVGIEYFEQADISVSLDQADPLIVGVDYGWASATTIQFLPTVGVPGGLVPNGVEVLLRRHTESDEMFNVYDGGAPFSRKALDENFEQLLRLSQEFSEGLGLDGLRNNLNMNGYRVTDLGSPVADADAVNKLYVDDALNKTVRTPDGIPSLPSAGARANRVLAFDGAGNPVVSVPVSGSAADLAIALADPVNSLNGASLVGFVRTRIADQIINTQQALSGKRVSIFEYAKYIPVRMGPPNTWDWTMATVTAQAAVSAWGGGVIEYPTYQYPHRYIRKLPYVSLEGEGSYNTYFTALPVADTGEFGFIEIAPGAVSGSHMRGIHIMGSATTNFGAPVVNPNQWGGYIKAQWDAGYVHGGWWFSIMDDVRVSNFNKGWWTRGGYTTNNFQRPIQFIEYRAFHIQVHAGGDALKQTGQHGQITFSGGAASGLDGVLANNAVQLDWDPNPATMADNASGHGESTSDVAGVGAAVQSPYNVHFSNGFTMEKSKSGFFGRNCRGVSFRGCWIERLARTFSVSTNGHLVVEACHLANPADGTNDAGAGTGFIYTVGSGGFLDFRSTNDVIGIVDNYLDPLANINNIGGLRVEGMGFGDTYQKFKATGFKTLTLTGGTINIGAHKSVVINPNAGDFSLKLATLQSTAGPGENVTVRALTGAITLTNLGNISLRGEAELTCPQNGTLVLQRIYQVIGNVEWMIVSVTEHNATASPTDGFYYARDHKIWRRGSVPAAAAGWVVTTAGLSGSTAVIKPMSDLGA